MRDSEDPASARDDSPAIASLAGPRMPADRGLTSLGLLMQLSGSLYCGFMALAALTIVFMDGQTPTDGVGAIVLFFAASALRSGFHRAAGTTLIYGSPAGSMANPLSGVRMYVLVALSHTALSAWLLHDLLGDTELFVGIVSLLAVWPITLAIVIRRPSIAAMNEKRPLSQDRGLEGSCVLMLIFGVIGMLFAIAFTYSSYTADKVRVGIAIKTGFTLVGVILFIRSLLHARAGKLGLSDADRGRVIHAIGQYVDFAKTSTMIISSLLALILLVTAPSFVGMLVVVTAACFLFVWPLAIDQFADRYRIDAGMGMGVYRAPDGGKTALGWLLLALGCHSAITALMQIAFDAPPLRGSLISTFDVWAIATSAGRSAWLFVPIALLQVWAAIELCAMSNRARVVASIYAATATLMTLYLVWPEIDDASRLNDMMQVGRLGSPGLEQLGLALIIPIATLVLANTEGFAVQARARFVKPTPDTSSAHRDDGA